MCETDIDLVNENEDISRCLYCKEEFGSIACRECPVIEAHDEDAEALEEES